MLGLGTANTGAAASTGLGSGTVEETGQRSMLALDCSLLALGECLMFGPSSGGLALYRKPQTGLVLGEERQPEERAHTHLEDLDPGVSGGAPLWSAHSGFSHFIWLYISHT